MVISKGGYNIYDINISQAENKVSFRIGSVNNSIWTWHLTGQNAPSLSLGMRYLGRKASLQSKFSSYCQVLIEELILLQTDMKLWPIKSHHQTWPHHLSSLLLLVWGICNNSDAQYAWDDDKFWTFPFRTSLFLSNKYEVVLVH